MKKMVLGLTFLLLLFGSPEFARGQVTECPPSSSLPDFSDLDCSFQNPCAGPDNEVSLSAPSSVGLGCEFGVSACGADEDCYDCTNGECPAERWGDHKQNTVVWPGAELVSGDGCDWNHVYATHCLSYNFRADSMTTYNVSATSKEWGCMYPDGDASDSQSIEVVCDWSFEIFPKEVCPPEVVTVKAYTNTCIADEDLPKVFSVEGGDAEVIGVYREGAAIVCKIAVDEDAQEGSVTVKAEHPLDGSCNGSIDFEILDGGDVPPPPSGSGGSSGGGGCTGCTNGSSGMGPGTPNSTNPGVAVSMGSLDTGEDAGSFRFSEDTPSAEIGKRSVLKWEFDAPGVERFTYDGGGLRSGLPVWSNSTRIIVIDDDEGLRQVAHKGMLADIVTTQIGGSHPRPDIYEIRLYDQGDFTASTSDYIFDIEVGAEPFAVYEVSNHGAPWGGDHMTVDYFERSDSVLVHRKRYDYQYVETTADEDWSWETSVQQYNDAADTYDTIRFLKTRWQVNTTTDETTRTHSVSEDEASAVFYEVVDVINSDDRRISRTIGGETTTWEYYTTGDSIGKLALETSPDGTWRAYQYDGTLNQKTTIEGWGNQPAPSVNTIGSITPTSTGDYRVRVRTLYTCSGDCIGYDDSRVGRPVSVSEYIQGTLVGQTTYSYVRNYSNLTITETRSSGSQSLTTVSLLDTNNNDRPYWIASPDGRFRSFGYSTVASSSITWPSCITPSQSYYKVETVYGGFTTETQGTGLYKANVSVKRRYIRDDRGQIVLQEDYVRTADGTTATQSWTSSPVSWVAYAYDDRGRQTDVYSSNGTALTYVYAQDACCGSRTITDDQGVVTYEEYDGLGRLIQTIQHPGDGSNPSAPKPITTDYTYRYVTGGDGTIYLEVESEITADGTTVDGQIRRIDALGRLVQQTDSAGLVTEYRYETTADGRRKDTVINSDTTTATKEYYLDGKIRSLSGDITEHAFKYSIDATGLIIQTTLWGTDDPSNSTQRWSKIYFNPLMQIVRESQSGFAGSTVETINTYEDGTGLLLSSSASGNPKVNYEYDLQNGITRVGIKATGTGAFDPVSADRYSETIETYEQVDGNWWKQTRTIRYLKDNDAVAREIQTIRSRLTGYVESIDTEHVTQETVGEKETFTEAGTSVVETSQSTVTTNRSTASQVTTTVSSDASNSSVSISEYGRVISQQSATGTLTAVGYDAFGRQATVTEGGSVTQTTHFNALGQIDWREDGNGNRTSFAYSPTTGRLSTISTQVGSEVLSSHFGYNNQGLVAKVWGNSRQPVWIEYDGFRQRRNIHTYREESPSGEGDWPEGDVTSWEYDPATGLLITETDPHLNTIEYTYTDEGKLKERFWARNDETNLSERLKTSYIYYGSGDDPADGFSGELKAIDYSNTPGTLEEPYDIVYTYNRSGNLSSVADTRPHTPSYTYDYSSWPASITETVDWGSGQTSTLTHAFDVAGRRTGLSEVALGYAAGYTYDPATGRMDTVTGPGLPDLGAAYSYVPAMDLVGKVQFHEDNSGQPRLVATGNRYYEVNRNLISGVSNYTYPNDVQTQISSYGYVNDELGRRTQITYDGTIFGAQAGLAQSLQYNGRSELTYAGNAPSDNKRGFDYDNMGNRMQMMVGDGVRTLEYSANAMNQYYLVHEMGSQHLSQCLHYDLDGNLTSIFHRNPTTAVRGGFLDAMTGPEVETPLAFVPSSAESSVELASAVEVFDGDGAPELLAWFAASGESPVSDSVFAASDFSLALLASILGQSSPLSEYDLDQDGDVDILDYAALMQMSKSLEGDSISLSWDAENRLVSVEPNNPVVNDLKVVLAYDYKGRRIYKATYTHTGTDWAATATSQTRYLFDGWNVIAELDAGSSNAAVRQYTWGLDLSGSLGGAGGVGGLLSVLIPGSGAPEGPGDQSGIYFYDANGNVVQVIDLSDLSVAAHYEYSPYGERVNTYSDTLDQPFRFSTKLFDAETGFGYWGYRHYCPTLGRWLNQDPIKDLGKRKTSLMDDYILGDENSYLALRNNPVLWFDPDGMQTRTRSKPNSDCRPATYCNSSGCWVATLDRNGKPCKIYGEVLPKKYNCAGYGLGYDCAVRPTNNTSLFELAGAMGFSCTTGISAKDCGEHCGCCNGFIMIYVYIKRNYNFDYARKSVKGDSEDDFFNKKWGRYRQKKSFDYHFLRGDKCPASYSYQNNMKKYRDVGKDSYDETNPDYFSNKKQLLGKACCCKKKK